MPRKFFEILNADDHKTIKTCDYEEVSTCPLCHFGIIPVPLRGCYITSSGLDDYEATIYILFLCPHCREVFLAKYAAYVGGKGLSCLNLLALSPQNAQVYGFSQSIYDMSPAFVETFNQSATAEAENLTEIAGCGYRKAVEYLVKDYLCHKFPDESEPIKAEFLGVAIRRIEDPRIKTLAERAVWIGNDETHYIKKHEALDIDAMKRFIAAMLSYIEAELSLEEALSIDPKQ